MSSNSHLTLDKINFIKQELTKNISFKEIAKYLSKAPTTISKEVRKHRIRKEGQSIYFNFNHSSKECRYCNHCKHVCSNFVSATCLC